MLLSELNDYYNQVLQTHPDEIAHPGWGSAQELNRSFSVILLVISLGPMIRISRIELCKRSAAQKSFT